MADFTHPALEAFLNSFQEEANVAQLHIRAAPPGFELRHVADREASASTLRLIRLDETLRLAQFTGKGRFRPLRSAPNLRVGWRLPLRAPEELASALNIFYPGFLADWLAVKQGATPTSFETFTSRQTGMYRATSSLSPEQAALAIRAACHPRFCLKQRLWSAQKTPPDPPHEKSILPCLEPCALLLEFSRQARRLEEDKAWTITLGRDELATLQEAVKTALHQAGQAREADFSDPANPRRLQMLREKLKAQLPPSPNPIGEAQAPGLSRSNPDED